jgi:hypothetical protein
VAELKTRAPQLEVVWLPEADHLLIDRDTIELMDLVRPLLPGAPARAPRTAASTPVP